MYVHAARPGLLAESVEWTIGHDPMVMHLGGEALVEGGQDNGSLSAAERRFERRIIRVGRASREIDVERDLRRL